MEEICDKCFAQKPTIPIREVGGTQSIEYRHPLFTFATFKKRIFLVMRIRNASTAHCIFEKFHFWARFCKNCKIFKRHIFQFIRMPRLTKIFIKYLEFRFFAFKRAPIYNLRYDVFCERLRFAFFIYPD